TIVNEDASSHIQVSDFHVFNERYGVFEGSITGQSRIEINEKEDFTEFRILGPQKVAALMCQNPDIGEPTPDYLTTAYIKLNEKNGFAKIPSVGVAVLIKADKLAVAKGIYEPYSKEFAEIVNFSSSNKDVSFMQILQMENVTLAYEGKKNYPINQLYELQKRLIERFPIGLKQVLEGYFEELMNVTIHLIDKGFLRVSMTDTGIFKGFYKKILEKLPKGTTIKATSLPSEKYLWSKDDDTLKQIENFVKDGGKMIRFFFLYNENKTIPEQYEVIQKHFEAYGQEESQVAVYLVFFTNLSDEEQRDLDYLIATTFRPNHSLPPLSWEVYVTNSLLVKELLAYSNEEKHEEFDKKFQALENLSSDKLQKVDETWLDNNIPKQE
ncbi:MAG: hypothetical protein ACKVTZ_12425, partial [Bacteroidia bacterium]